MHSGLKSPKSLLFKTKQRIDLKSLFEFYAPNMPKMDDF